MNNNQEKTLEENLKTQTLFAGIERLTILN